MSVERDVQQKLAQWIRNPPKSPEEIGMETKKYAVLRHAPKRPIRPDPVLSPQTQTPWTRKSTNNRGYQWYKDWNTELILLDARITNDSSFGQWDTIYVSQF
ncbi:unnamed protein product [Hymenolepis diminuta]|uniref:Uncharacterized protein n=1 Tax=Hymenolepis diminuta TaxID=6216 RepID=A0A564Y3M7_HYMDI|nr:unnamed protein product [Hymenolepis diminuta]